MDNSEPEDITVMVKNDVQESSNDQITDGPHEQQHPQNFGGYNNRQGGNRFRGNRRGNFRPFQGNRNQGNNQFNRKRLHNNNMEDDNQQGQSSKMDGGNRKFFYEKLMNISKPTIDLPPLDTTEKQFNGRNRLYIGNISGDVTEDELKELFKPYGEVSEVFINKDKNFVFLRMDYRINAEKAKRELDGQIYKEKNLKIRFAPSNCTIKIRNLPHFVSNELLYHSFQIFGEIERSLLLVDEKGKPTGEAIIDFAKKGYAMHAIRQCKENSYFLTASLRPCIVESFDVIDDIDGYPEKLFSKKNPEYVKARNIGPRFAGQDSFECEFGERYKQIYKLFDEKKQALEKELEMELDKMEAQMEFARYEHETEMLRSQLRQREMDRDRQKAEWEMKERQAEQLRLRNEEDMRRQENEIQQRILQQDDEIRRRHQENNLFLQAHQLDNMIKQVENQTFNSQPPGNFNMNNEAHVSHIEEPKVFMNNFKRNNRFDGRGGDMGPSGPRNNGGGNGGGGGGGNIGGNRGHWVNNNDNRRDDYGSKRRRF